MPWVDNVAVSADHTSLSWTITGGSPSAYDAVDAYVTFRTPVSGSTPAYFVRWHAMLPPGTTSLDLASAPAELAPYLPTAAGVTIDAMRVDLVDLPAVDGYAAMRAAPEWQWTRPSRAVYTGEVPTATFAEVTTGAYSLDDSL
jgi:hypothetical protein